MESIEELDKICRKGANDEIWLHYLFDKIGLHCTWLLLHTPFTPNQITITGIIIGFLGVILVTFPTMWIHWLGYILILLYYFTDFSDGQVARYKKLSSLKGKYLDYIGHIAVYPLMFLSMGIYLFNTSGRQINLLIGAATAFFIIAIFIMNKLYILVAGKNSGQLYNENKKKSLRWYLFRIHKTINFQLYIFLFVFIFEALQLLFPSFNNKLIFYLLLYTLIISSFTFFLQVYIRAKILEKIND